MQRKTAIFLGLFAPMLTMPANAAAFSRAGYWEVEGSPRVVRNLNLGWEFSLDGFRTAKPVTLPHSIDDGELGYEASGCVNRQQPAWYRRKFDWQPRGARQFVHFEAIMGKSRVTLNGQSVAEHFGGYLPIHAEVTGILRAGENLLEVWCDNSDDPTYPPGKPQKNLDFCYFGGIYRDAYLIETGDAYVTDSDRGGAYVSTALGADGLWTVETTVTLGGNVEGAELRYFLDGEPVAAKFTRKDPTTWSPEHPNLHVLRVEVVKAGKVVDAVGVRFGFRDLRMDGKGLTLNGRPYPKKLIGVNRHQDCLFLGNALPNSMHWRDVKKFRDCGMTIFRNAHQPQDPAFMDACDELGMFVIVNTPGWQFWNPAPIFGQRVLDDVLKMTRRDRSHPCVFLWEPVLNESSYPAEFAVQAMEIVKRETRAPNYCACDIRTRGSEKFDAAFQLSPDFPHRAAFTREWGDFPDDWNAQNSSSRAAIEWGECAMVEQARHYRDEARMGSLRDFLGDGVPAGLLGGTMWHGCDHARGFHPDNFFGGLLTYGRQKKYSWHLMKAVLGDEPYVFLAHELAPGSPHAMPVYANCAYKATWLGREFVPELTEFWYDQLQAMTYYPEDKSLTEKAYFEIAYPDGRRVRQYPAKRVDHLALALDTEGLAPQADGSDVVAVTATLVDARGTPKRYLNEKVRFTVEGPATIVGENPQCTRWGEAIVYLRLQAQSPATPITVRAELARQGYCTAAYGQLVFTPGACDAAVTFGKFRSGTAASAALQDAAQQEVENDQKKFDNSEKLKSKKGKAKK